MTAGAHQAETPRTPLAANGLRIAFLLSRYPAISHTFFMAEVKGLRELGLTIETASINPPDRALEALPPEEQQEAQNTSYIKGGSRKAALRSVLSIAFRNPGVLFRGLAAVSRVSELTLRRRTLWLAYLAEALLVGDWMRSRNLQHLHIHFGGPVAAVGMLVSQAWRIPCSITIHGPEELLDRRAFHLREKLLQASFVICISEFCRSQCMHILPAEQWNKLHVVRLGVSPRFVDATMVSSDANGSAKRPVHCVCVGRLVPEKGQRILLQAVAAARASGLALKCTLVGDGADRAELQQFAGSLGITDAVHFAGALSHPQTHAMLHTADVFALASFAEGLPVALMEAMALGIPCISTSIAGIPELIRNDVNGKLTIASDSEELAATLIDLARSPKLRQRLGEAAQAEIATHYHLPTNLQQLAQVFAAHKPMGRPAR